MGNLILVRRGILNDEIACFNKIQGEQNTDFIVHAKYIFSQFYTVYSTLAIPLLPPENIQDYETGNRDRKKTFV